MLRCVIGLLLRALSTDKAAVLKEANRFSFTFQRFSCKIELAKGWERASIMADGFSYIRRCG